MLASHRAVLDFADSSIARVIQAFPMCIIFARSSSCQFQKINSNLSHADSQIMCSYVMHARHFSLHFQHTCFCSHARTGCEGIHCSQDIPKRRRDPVHYNLDLSFHVRPSPVKEYFALQFYPITPGLHTYGGCSWERCGWSARRGRAVEGTNHGRLWGSVRWPACRRCAPTVSAPCKPPTAACCRPLPASSKVAPVPSVDLCN